jgi:ketosteroid isomerase-like protein
MSQENVKLVRRTIDAYNRRDRDTLHALSHPDVEIDWSASIGPEPRIYRGREQAADFYDNFLGMFERVHLVPECFIEAGDAVVVPNSAQLRGRDGIKTVARSTLVYELRGGLIARVCLYQETADALEAVGLRE